VITPNLDAPPIRRYGAALVLVVSAVALRWLLDPVLGETLPLSTVYGFVALAVWYGGWGPGLLTSILGYAAINWLIMPPRFSFHLQQHDAWGIVAYVSSVSIIIVIGELVRRTQRQIAETAALASDRLQQLQAEVDERRQAEERLGRSERDFAEFLRVSERRYRELIERLPAAVYTCDAEGRIQLYNQAAEDLWGRKLQIGEDVWCGSLRLSRPDGSPLPLAESPMAVAVRQGRGSEGEEIIIHRPDGSTRHVLAYPRPIRDESGMVTGAVNMLLDLTERKRTEDHLKANEVRTRAMFDSALDALITMDAEGRVQDFNPAAERIFGYRRADAIGHLVAELIIPPELRERHRAGLRRYLETGEISVLGRRIHMPALTAEGKEIPVEFSITVTRQPGLPPFFTASLRDISDRIRSERATAHLAAIVTSSDDAIISKDVEGIVTSWNASAERLFGYTAEEMIGQPVLRLIPADGQNEEREILSRISRGERIEHYETVRCRKDGTRLTVSLTISPLFDAHGRVIGASKIARDITHQKRAEEALRDRERALSMANDELLQQKAGLAEANKELQSFSYSVSHDLRAPLRTIDAYVRIVEEDHLPELNTEVRRCLGVVKKAAGQAGELIDDLLEFSRLGRVGMDFRPTRMTELAREVAEGLQTVQQGCALDLTIGDLPRCHGDWRLLKAVWTNLLGNAFKFTRYRDPAQIEVGWLPDDRQADATVYYVKDNGVGFDMKYAHKLFGVFQRLHLKDEFEGTGVGLAIVQRIVQRHGGRVWAEGKVDGGATFFFSLRKAQQ
jgi:PAS domain S-box-containing protein